MLTMQGTAARVARTIDLISTLELAPCSDIQSMMLYGVAPPDQVRG
jgi:hypothetical protein